MILLLEGLSAYKPLCGLPIEKNPDREVALPCAAKILDFMQEFASLNRGEKRMAASDTPLYIHASNKRRKRMNIIFLQPIVALIAGILILIVPRLLNYIVAIYLIIIGIIGLTQ